MSTDKQQRPNANGQGISERRRQMLRAAATAAPLVATLPSGAVLANASAFQCIAADKAATDAGEFNFVYDVNGTTLVTVQASVQSGTKTVGDAVSPTPDDSQGTTRSQSWRSGLTLSMRVPKRNDSRSVAAATEDVTVYRIGEAPDYKYYEYLGDVASVARTTGASSPLSESDANPNPEKDKRYELSGGWQPVELVRVYDIGTPPYTDVNEDCGSEPCLLLARGPTNGTDLTALNGSCMASVVTDGV